MVNSIKKTEDFNKILDNLRKKGENKQCFDCGEKGTTYVVLNFGTFVCSNCAGIHREFNYKVKGLGVSNFTDKEITFLQENGNLNAKKTWLGNFDLRKHKLPDPKISNDVKTHIRQKYQEKKFYLKIKEQPKVQEKDKFDKETSDQSSDEETKKRTKSSNKTVQKKEDLKDRLSPILVKGPTQTNDSLKPSNELRKESNKNNKRGSFDNEVTNATKNQNIDQIVASNQSKINNIDWENIWGGNTANVAKTPEIIRNNNNNASPITNQPPVNQSSNSSVNRAPVVFSFDFIDNSSKPSQSSNENDNNFILMNNMGNNQNSNNNINKVNTTNNNQNLFPQFDNVGQNNKPNNQMNVLNNNSSLNNNNSFNLYKKEDPLDRLLLESNFNNNQNFMAMGQMNTMNNMNPFVNQLRMNPMLMQQYYMVMQNPNLNPQMYTYFNQMMQMNNMQNNNNFINQQIPSQMNMNQHIPSQMNMNNQMPSQFNMNQQNPSQMNMNQQMPSNLNLNQQMPSQMNMNQQMPSNLNLNQQAPSFQQQNSYNPSVNLQQPNNVTSLNKNSLQINTSFNFTNTTSVSNDQNNYGYNNANKINIVNDIFDNETPKNSNNQNFNPFV